MTTSMNKVIFLDRDGTINVMSDEWWKLERFELCAGAAEGLKMLQDVGYKLAVVTNQGGVELGMYTEQDIHDLHDHMKKQLREYGVTLDAIAYCISTNISETGCRKPATGMVRQIERELGPIDFLHSWMIGDKTTDMMFGKNIKAKTALIRSNFWEDSQLKEHPDVIVHSLLEAAQRIAKR